MLETGALIDRNGKVIYWHLPNGRSAGYLPDSRDLWDVIWENRDKVIGFAHSHPGSGVPQPSMEDLTTFRAIERALGRKLTWWITSRTNTSVVVMIDTFVGDKPGLGSHTVLTVQDEAEPSWIWKLREHSYVPEPREPDPVP